MIFKLACFLLFGLLLCSIGILLHQCFTLIFSDLLPPSRIKNKIPFKSFKSFYGVNPNRWVLESNYVIGVKSSSTIEFKFNLIDTLRYKRFLRNLEKIEERIATNKEYSEMIACIREDIDSLEIQSRSEMNAAVKNIKDITSCM
jgi:hypothetical protein